MKKEEIIKHNLELYKTFKSKIESGWWGWHMGIVERFRCVECGEMLRGSNYLSSFFKNKKEEACKEVICYNCYSNNQLKNMSKNGHK